MFLASVIEKCIDQLETKMIDADPSVVAQHVQPLKNNHFKACISYYTYTILYSSYSNVLTISWSAEPLLIYYNQK